MAEEAAVLVTAKAIQAKLADLPYSVLVRVAAEDDALESMEVLVVHGVRTRKAVAERVEVALAATGLMAQTIYSDVVMAVAVPLEVVDQHQRERLGWEERQVVEAVEAEVLMPLVVAL